VLRGDSGFGRLTAGGLQATGLSPIIHTKGHITHAAGKDDHVALALPVPDNAFARK